MDFLTGKILNTMNQNGKNRAVLQAMREDEHLKTVVGTKRGVTIYKYLDGFNYYVRIELMRGYVIFYHRMEYPYHAFIFVSSDFQHVYKSQITIFTKMICSRKAITFREPREDNLEICTLEFKRESQCTRAAGMLAKLLRKEVERDVSCCTFKAKEEYDSDSSSDWDEPRKAPDQDERSVSWKSSEEEVTPDLLREVNVQPKIPRQPLKHSDGWITFSVEKQAPVMKTGRKEVDLDRMIQVSIRRHLIRLGHPIGPVRLSDFQDEVDVQLYMKFKEIKQTEEFRWKSLFYKKRKLIGFNLCCIAEEPESN